MPLLLVVSCEGGEVEMNNTLNTMMLVLLLIMPCGGGEIRDAWRHGVIFLLQSMPCEGRDNLHHADVSLLVIMRYEGGGAVCSCP